MTPSSKMFYRKLGSDIFAIVSEYKNFPSIGIRKCMLIKKSNKLIIGKTGINLITPQYRALKNNINEIIESMVRGAEKEWDLGFDVKCRVGSKTLYQLLIERNDRSIIIDRSMLNNLRQYFDDIDEEVDKIFESQSKKICIL